MIPVFWFLILLLFYALVAQHEADYFYYRRKIGVGYRLNREFRFGPIVVDYEHALLTGIRGCVWYMFYALTSWHLLVCGILLFPLVHDGLYFMRRNRIEGIYTAGFFDYSKDDRSLLSFKFPIRLVLAAIGVLVEVKW